MCWSYFFSSRYPEQDAPRAERKVMQISPQLTSAPGTLGRFILPLLAGDRVHAAPISSCFPQDSPLPSPNPCPSSQSSFSQQPQGGTRSMATSHCNFYQPPCPAPAQHAEEGLPALPEMDPFSTMPFSMQEGYGCSPGDERKNCPPPQECSLWPSSSPCHRLPN